MTAVGLWLRRGVGPWVGLLAFGFGAMTVFSQANWVVEWDWGARLLAAVVIVLGPLVSAATAYQQATLLGPALSVMHRRGVRRVMPVIAPAVAVGTCVTIALLSVWAAVGVRVTVANGIGPTDWWVYPEVLLPLWAAVGIGMLVGSVVDGLFAGPVAAVVVVLLTVLGTLFGRSPFSAVTTYGTLTGLERPASQAVAVVAACSAILLLTTLATVARSSPRRTNGSSAFVVTVVLVAACATLPAALPWREQVFRTTSEERGCVRGTPTVCGPVSRLPLLVPVQRSLSRAYGLLDGTPFTQPTTFTVTRLDEYSSIGDDAPLDFDPADVENGRYSDAAVARALVRPHQCDELFDAAEAVPLLDAQGIVLPWLVSVLGQDRVPTAVPPAVTKADDVIRSCRVRTTNLR